MAIIKKVFFIIIRLTDNDFLALVDVDAGRGRHLGAHGTAHQVVVVRVNRVECLVDYNLLVDAVESAVAVAHALVDDLAVLDDVAQAAVIGSRLDGIEERRRGAQGRVHADAFDQIMAQSVKAAFIAGCFSSPRLM